MNTKAYLQLMRPANLLTAIADVLAGAALGSVMMNVPLNDARAIALLSFSTFCLYGGGVVMNDVFDAELDAIERPERPIPSGKVSKTNATILGLSLLALGILAASLHRNESGLLAGGIALMSLLYDRFGKHSSLFGPLNMGACRGLNLLLGLSLVEVGVAQGYWLGLVPVIYIAAITMISRDEVHGGKSRTLYYAGFLYGLVSISQLMVASQFKTLWITLPFVVLHLYLLYKPLSVAILNPIGPNIGKAVKAGVLSLIVMDAAWVSVSGNWPLALAVLVLLPLSIPVARFFAVT